MSDRRRLGAVRRRGGDSGGSAIEFAILAPFLLAMLFGVFEIGWAFNCSFNVRHALEYTGRALQLNPAMTQSDLQTSLTSQLPDLPPTSTLVLTYTKSTSSGGVSLGEIDVSYTHPLGYPLVDIGSFTFKSSAMVPLNGS